MLLFEKNNVDKKQALSELMNGSGVFVVKNVYTLDQINEAISSMRSGEIAGRCLIKL